MKIKFKFTVKDGAWGSENYLLTFVEQVKEDETAEDTFKRMLAARRTIKGISDLERERATETMYRTS